MFSLTSSTTLILCLSSAHFLIALCSRLDLSHFIVVQYAWCQCDQTIDDLDTHLFWCPYKTECISIHNTFLDIVAAITLKSGPHVQREVSHLFSHHIWWWMDIFLYIKANMVSVRPSVCPGVDLGFRTSTNGQD
jgi:hypothetical protein